MEMRLLANIGNFLGAISSGIDRFITTMNECYDEKTKGNRDKKIAKEFSTPLIARHFPCSHDPIINQFSMEGMIYPFANSPKTQAEASGKKRKVIKYLGGNKTRTNGNCRAKHGKCLVPAVNN